MINTYFFVLGTSHTLSKIDIVNFLTKDKVDFTVVEASEEILLITTEQKLDTDLLMAKLGSAAKIGEVFKVYQKDSWTAEFLKDILTSEGKERFKGEKFGLSVYNAGGKFKELNEVFGNSKEVSQRIRETLNLREVREPGRVLSTVTVDKNGLLEKGFELIVAVGSQGVYLGKTLVLQDYESYSLRDYGRPARDALSGMIPPKLAKMMINLAGRERTDLFLDPFCGSGTFLQELILLGYKDIVGTDSSAKSVADSTTNLDWLFETYHLKKTDYQVKVVKADVRKLSSQVSFKTVSTIVSEPYLGSPRAKHFNEEEIKKEVKKLEELYLAAFDEFRKVLKNKGVIVIIFPVFRFKNEFFYLKILDQIVDLGFKQAEYLWQKHAIPFL